MGLKLAKGEKFHCSFCVFYRWVAESWTGSMEWVFGGNYMIWEFHARWILGGQCGEGWGSLVNDNLEHRLPEFQQHPSYLMFSATDESCAGWILCCYLDFAKLCLPTFLRQIALYIHPVGRSLTVVGCHVLSPIILPP